MASPKSQQQQHSADIIELRFAHVEDDVQDVQKDVSKLKERVHLIELGRARESGKYAVLASLGALVGSAAVQLIFRALGKA